MCTTSSKLNGIHSRVPAPRDSASEGTGVNHRKYRRPEEVQIDREWGSGEELVRRCILTWNLKSGHHLNGEEREGHLKPGEGNLKNTVLGMNIIWRTWRLMWLDY